MAVFLLKAKLGEYYTPPPPTGAVFTDVPVGAFAAAWIEDLAARGITGGCGGNDYCPGATVTRRQMAAFLLKAEHGSDYVPPAATGIFGDVPPSDAFAPWIERLYEEQVYRRLPGAPLLYCPTAPTRAARWRSFSSRLSGWADN